MRRKRYQQGCVREVKHGSRRTFIGKFYDTNGVSRTKVLGHPPQMTKAEAWLELQKYLKPINEAIGFRPSLPTNFGEYVTSVFVPHRRQNWKEDSTEKTTLERMHAHLFPAFGSVDLRELNRDRMQQFLNERATMLSRSVVDHLKWDLRSIFKMASDDGLVIGNPAGSLVTPKAARSAVKLRMSEEEYHLGLSVLGLRASLIYRLAALVGLRPGEIFSLRWGRITPTSVAIVERVYRGSKGDPKTRRSRRNAGVPPDVATDLGRWRELCTDVSEEALVFPSERGTFLSRDNFLRRNINKELAKVGLGWVNFQVLRRTQASLSHDKKIDPKIAADQRGHSVGVGVDVYTQSNAESRLEAVTRLEADLKKKCGKPDDARAAASNG
jgi:integrase